MADGNDVSFLPSEAQEGGGGLLQAVAGATLTFEAVQFDYNGSVAVAVPALHVHGDYTDEDGSDATFDEYYSGGDATRLRAKKDGTGWQALTEGAGLTKTSKIMQFLNALVSANGGDESILTANIKDLDGINVDMERKPDIDRPGLEATNKVGRKRTVFLVTVINAQPGETPKKGKGKVAAGKPVGKPVAGKPAGKTNVRKEAIAAVEAVIEAQGGSVSKDDLAQLVFRANKKNPNVKAFTEFAADEEFLAADDTPWGYTGEELTSA